MQGKSKTGGHSRNAAHGAYSRTRPAGQVRSPYIRRAALPCRRKKRERLSCHAPRVPGQARFVLWTRAELSGSRRCPSGKQEIGLDQKAGM